MKLLRLKINDKFRSLQQGFEIYFLRDFDRDKTWDFMPYCLAGRNGSGKSNILEALASIFYHIECMYLDLKPEGFEATEDDPAGFRSETSFPDAFELEYLYPASTTTEYKGAWAWPGDTEKHYITAHVRITKNQGEAPKIEWVNRHELGNNDDAELSRLEIKQLLPDYVIGYSSGENEILSLPFFKMRFIHFDEYEERLRKKLDYSYPEGRLVFMDTPYSQAVFLTNYMMQDDKILKPIFDVLGIKGIDQFRIIIQQNKNVQEWDVPEDAPIIDRSAKDDGMTSELTSKLNNTIEKFKKCSTCMYKDEENGVLYLDYWVNEQTKYAFRQHFEDDPLALFRAFQILLTLNLYDVSRQLKKEIYQSSSLYVNETVPSLASDKRIMRFKDLEIKTPFSKGPIYSKALSDGEHQFLHAMGLCLLYKNTNSLFLLDEPETHFNPDWRASLISTLRKCLTDESKGKMRELLISSHSPFIISDCHEENVLLFKKDDNTGVVSCKRPDFKTFGASVNQITIKAFGKVETIGNYAKEKLDKLYQRLKEGENADVLIEDANKTLGDSVEKIIFVNKVLESKGVGQ